MTHQRMQRSDPGFQIIEQIKADLQAILDGIKDVIFVINPQYIISRVNKTYLSLLEKNTFQSVIGKQCFREIFKRENVCAGCPAKEAFKTGRVSFARKNYIFESGKRLTMDIFAYPLRNKLGELEKVIVCARDVTVKDKYERYLRKHVQYLINERRFLEKHPFQQNDAAGKFAIVLAHEIRSPLDLIINKIDYLLMEKLHGEVKLVDILKDFEKIRDYAYYIAKITDGLLEFSDTSHRFFSPLEVNAVLMNAVDLAKRRGFGKNIHFECKLAPNLPKVMGNSICLERCFLNILNNAIDAIPEEGSVKIETQISPETEDVIQIIISDTGVGIPKKDFDKIFNPFYTTKQGQKGIGLGLAISQWIIREHNGTIKVRSYVGRGTTFIISLPITRGH